MSGIEALWANPAVQATAWALVHFLWQGALVGIAAAGALALLRNGSASARYSVAMTALLVLLACPVVTALWLGGTPEAATVVPVLEAEAGAAPAAQVSTFGAAPVLSSQAQDFLPAALPWVFALWLAGVAALSVYHLGGLYQTRAWTRRGARPAAEEWEAKLRVLARRLGIGREVELLESAAAQVPAVIGWLKPVILVPASALAGLSPRQLEAILAHELAHVRRHDYLVNLLQTVVETLLFYHPAVWWVSTQIRRERENCCDDMAVAVCGDRLVYARALAELEGLRVPSPRLAMAADGGSLVARIRRLAGVPARDSRRSWLAGALALSLLPAGAAFNFYGVSGAADMDEPATSLVASLDSSEPAVPQPPRTERAAGRPEKAEKEDKDVSSAAGDDDKVEVRMPRSGTWTLERKKGDLFRLETEMREQGNHWVNNTDVRASELKGLSNGPNVRFEIPRDAGTLQFQGSFDGSKGKGTFTFAANPDYQRQMRGLGYEVSDSRLLELYIHDVSLDFAREMTALGKLSTSKLVELSIHGVTPEYVREMAGLGYEGLSANKLVEFKIHGVSPELVRALVDTGYADLPPNKVVEFKIHGVTPGYIRGLADAGYRDLPPNKLVEFKIHGVNEKFIRDAERRGYKNLTPNELVELKIMGRLHGRGED